ncbi:LLM class flavin-dependent oxidoreductase [Microlunatus speluncae]|uniref:LLM class flavin-dependent oxidoreductase n=1 Tax=Microlunatus speluncae TaxID=2594267 RepID=UPI00126613CA|nr:LLM class flavin-dependent oxidoreductase [Microlunatus speluncae]
MTDYGHELQFGGFLTPDAGDPDRVVDLVRLAEQSGLDLVSFQDHPYQPAFLDAWTLISYVAGRTERITLTGNVFNLPLRPPSVLARSVASLDRLTGGRIELGLGSGAFWDAIEAMGGERRTPGEAVRSVEEAIMIMRELWDDTQRGGVRVRGRVYQVDGAKRGPAPAHRVQIWLGAYKPRMLELTGRLADGWLPSLSYLQPGDLTRGNKIIDEAAIAAGREPRAVRRLLNLGQAEPAELAELALTEGIGTFIAMIDDPTALQRFAQETAPAVRELVDAARRGGGADPSAGVGMITGPDPVRAGAAESEVFERIGVRPTPDDGSRLLPDQPWDEGARPHLTPAPDASYSAQGGAVGQHLIDVHDHLRQELETVRDLVDQVKQGTIEAARARSVINELTLKQNNWAMGAYCASYCRVVTQHHTIEDRSMFPHLRRSDPELVPVLDRLTEEHQVIHGVLEELDRRLVEHLKAPGEFTELQRAVDRLTDTLRSHLSYEERELVEPLARIGMYAGQV